MPVLVGGPIASVIILHLFLNQMVVHGQAVDQLNGCLFMPKQETDKFDFSNTLIKVHKDDVLLLASKLVSGTVTNYDSAKVSALWFETCPREGEFTGTLVFIYDGEENPRTAKINFNSTNRQYSIQQDND